MTTPRTETTAFRVWSYASPRGWDCTIAEIADVLDISTQRVRAICTPRGWVKRLRSGEHRPLDAATPQYNSFLAGAGLRETIDGYRKGGLE